MLRKYWILILTFLIIFTTTIVGYQIRSKDILVVDDLMRNLRYISVSGVDNFDFASGHVNNGENIKYGVPTLNDLEINADAVLIVIPQTRKQYDGYFETRCIIKKIIQDKSKQLQVNEEIYIFERASLSPEINLLSVDTPLMPMELESEYIVYLQQIKEYRTKKRFEIPYINYGVIPVKYMIAIADIDADSILNKEPISTQGYLDYQSLKEADILYYNKEFLDKSDEQWYKDYREYLTAYKSVAKEALDKYLAMKIEFKLFKFYQK